MIDTESLSDERIAEIRQRANAARPGPWTVEDNKTDLNRWVTNEDGTLEVNFGYLGNNNQDDAQFTAHAREDVPALLAALDQANAVIQAAYEFADEMGDYCSPHGIAAVYADRLRERLDQAQPNRATDRAQHGN